MDGLFRKEKYKEYVDMIKDVKNDVSTSMFDKRVKNQTDGILEELKDKSDVQYLNLALIFLTVPLLIVLVSQYIEYGFTIRTVTLLLLLAFFFLYRSAMKSVTVESVLKGRSLEKFAYDEHNEKEGMNAKLEYILSGIAVKQSRLNLTKWYYTLFFPFLMIFVTEIIKGRFEAKWYIIGLVIAFLTGGYFWWKFFSYEIEDLATTKDEIIDIQRRVNS